MNIKLLDCQRKIYPFESESLEDKVILQASHKRMDFSGQSKVLVSPYTYPKEQQENLRRIKGPDEGYGVSNKVESNDLCKESKIN